MKKEFNGLSLLDNEGMRQIVGGYTSHTVTVIAPAPKRKENTDNTVHEISNPDDGDDNEGAD
ncbi:MAG: hypothetical protein FWD66_08425 [Paludibacter sp.]|nr:hypothetical protein [Paludibacter sp.]